jgi:hypothetical protein
MTTDAAVPPPEPLHVNGADFGAIDADLGDELEEDDPVDADQDITL